MRINNIIVLIYLLLISNAVVGPALCNYDQKQVDESIVLKIIKFIPPIILIITNPRIQFKKVKLHTADKIIILIGIFFLVSTIWSTAKSITFADSIQFLFFLFVCFYLIFLEGEGRLKMMNVFRGYLLLTGVITVILYFFFPSVGRMSGEYDYAARGVFLHKNILASTFVTFLPISLVISTKEKRINYFLCMLILLVVFLSKSGTSIIALVIVIVLSFFIKKISKNGILLIVPMLTLTLYFLYFNYSTEILKLLDKSEDLTGRVQLWNNLIRAFLQKPLLGYGYWGFWNSSIKTYTFSDMVWVTGKSHNAFLDVALSGGILLLIVCICYLLAYFLKVLYYHSKEKRSLGILSLVGILVLSMAEIGLFEHNNINLLFLVYLSHYGNDNSFYYLSRKEVQVIQGTLP